jgi:hypothetical protein
MKNCLTLAGLFFVFLIISLHAAFVSAADARIPAPIMNKIKARAASDSPGNTAAQKDTINRQSAAYNRVDNYSNKEIPAVVLNKIRVTTTQYYPFDYSAQLFFINQQVNSYLKLGVLSERLFPPKVVDCENLKWKLAVSGTPATYRGTVDPGSVDVIYVEVRGSRGLLGQNYGFTNPGGSFEVMVWGDLNIRRKHKEKFYCEKY